MGEALVAMAKFSMGIQIKDPETFVRIAMEALIEDANGECTVP